ncbi:hypothetical protein SHIRM173S_07111 [Streptomyces hirsutus]
MSPADGGMVRHPSLVPYAERHVGTEDRPPGLRGDCAQCFGLCCVALPFTASAAFAVDKEAGRPCRNLREDHRCGIHARLRQEGFSGCTVYDCFGAGQKVSQVTFGGEAAHPGPGAGPPHV